MFVNKYIFKMDVLPGSSVICLLLSMWLISVTNGDPSVGCEPIEVPMCKGLVGYNLTRLPNQFNHRTQSEVYWALQPWWPFMDTMCSSNLRLLLCGLFLPKCTPGSPRVQLPCRETCRKAKVRCSQEMQRQGRPWTRQFRCPQFLPKRTNRCIKPLPEKKKKQQRGHVACQQNTLSMCTSIGPPYTHGSLPNMFLQNNLPLMELEMLQYRPLVRSGCSPNLRFFLCGVFMPFCVQQREQDIPFVVPCRELCQEVYDHCHEEFTRTRSGLPWPGKLHCHRYPSFVDSFGTNHTVPCTMQPYAGRSQANGQGSTGTGTLQGRITAPQTQTPRPGGTSRRQGSQSGRRRPNRRRPGSGTRRQRRPQASRARTANNRQPNNRQPNNRQPNNRQPNNRQPNNRQPNRATRGRTRREG